LRLSGQAEATPTPSRAAGVHTRLVARSKGERHPRATNRTTAGRALNRRVELTVRYR